MKEVSFQEMATVQSPSELYHEASKIYPHDRNLFGRIYSVNNIREIRKIIAKPSTSRDGFPTFALPKDFVGLDQSLSQVLLRRTSSRNFSGALMSLADLSAILYFGAAVARETVDEFGIQWGLRCAPSGGALFPVDIYCAVNRVASLESGLYSYDSNMHSLQLLSCHNFIERLIESTYASNAEAAAFCILMVANFARSKFKYGERAYRFILIEAGHICQNMLLVASCLHHNAFPIGGYIDDALNALVGVDGCDQAVVYGLLAGVGASCLVRRLAGEAGTPAL